MIRKANIEDAKTLAKLIIDGWQTGYKGIISDDYLDNMQLDSKTEIWKENILNQNEESKIYVYEENEEVLGVIKFGKSEETDNIHTVEIYVLYVKPDKKRMGIGSKLLNYAKEEFIKEGHKKMIIWCAKQNIPSIKFYKKMGGKIIRERDFEFNELKIEEVGVSYNL